MEEEKEIKVKWANIKQYLEDNDYDLDGQDWGEVRSKVKQLDTIERSLMNRDIQKMLNTPDCIEKLVEKQKEYAECLDEITSELMGRQREIQKQTNRPLYLDYLKSSDPE
jgi:hypothetical protein